MAMNVAAPLAHDVVECRYPIDDWHGHSLLVELLQSAGR